jgi:ABC-type glycerol-3-phosphate transport system substrate-binding protein
VGAALCSSAAACAVGGRPDAGTTGDTSGAPVRVTLISRTSEQEAFEKRTAALMERYPKITLEYRPLGGDYGQVIRTNQAAGTLAMGGGLLAGNRANVRTAVQNNFRWSMVAMPKGPTGKFGAILTVAPIGMNKQTKAADQAWQVLKWFTDRETGVALGLQATGSATPAARKDVYCDERLLNDPAFSRDMLERVCKIMDQAASTPYTIPWNFRQTDVDAVVSRHVDAFRENRAAPNPATMRTFTAELQDVLDQPRV